MKNLLKLFLLFALNATAQRTDKSIQALYGATFQNATEVTTATKIPVFDTNLKLNTWISPDVFTNGFVQGAGTTNYVAKFTAAGTVGNSQIYDNGINVGIGTSNSFANLTISNNGAGGVEFFPGNATNTTQHYNRSSSAYVVNKVIASEYRFIAGSSEALTISTSGNVGIGTITPSAKLEVSGRISQVGTGESVFIGQGAGENDDLTDNKNVFVGFQAGQANTTGSSNVAQGYRSLWSNTTGSHNIAQGQEALSSNTTASFNIALGFESLLSNTTGTGNLALGYESLLNNTIGAGNVAQGYQALLSNTTGNNNIALGFAALLDNTTGNSNVSVGALSLGQNTTGFNNTVLGTGTGAGITTGNSNTILGANVTGLPSNLSNNIIIADGDGVQRIRVLDNGNVGIGTTTPTEKLEVIGSAKANSFIVDNGAVDGGSLVLKSIGYNDWQLDNNAGALRFFTGSSVKQTILSNGNVGIGTTTPSEKLEVIGNIEASNGFILTDTQNTNRYKITVVNGVLTTTLIP